VQLLLPETHLSRSAKNCPPEARTLRRAIALLVAVPAAALLAGCGGKQPKQTAQAPLVQAITVQPQQVPLSEEFVGRLSAYREANVLARVAGVLLQRRYTEGTEVHAGQPLFQIDPQPRPTRPMPPRRCGATARSSERT
jgi:multidrug efflux pump subunit AcrA (membrane-fusion protein)